MTSPATDDPFRTGELRRRVLEAWAASAARFREDANSEDDLVRGGYRDRVVVELAQNAADAAARAGVPGRLLLRLVDTGAAPHGVLVAANTGAPLDAAGVESLATLRASAKRDHPGGPVGRFGVGFAAVLAISDAPRIASATGGVRWDAAAAAELVRGVDDLRPELGRRHGQVPVLRLPFPAPAGVPDGFDTEVELPVRDAAARDLVRRLLAEVDDALVLALPALAEVVVEAEGARRVVTGQGWSVVRRGGDLTPDLLTDRPVEERDRPWWQLTWARPLAGQLVPPVLHAPTPTDEPIDLPALLVGSFPLEPTRRNVAPGPLTDRLVAEAAAGYVELVLQAESGVRAGLVPGPMAAGRLDAQLRRAVLAALEEAPWLQTLDGRGVAPRDAVSVVGAAPGVLALCSGVLADLVPDQPVLARLGARRLALADLVDLLSELDRPPAWWHDLYTALATGPADPEALGALPVPLTDGRLVRGPRSVLLPGGGLPPVDLAVLGLRLAHPEAAHPLLARLGAQTPGARDVLDRPEVRAAVTAAWDAAEPAAVTEPVLALADAAGLRPGDLPWLGSLPLRDSADELAGADELVLPGSTLDRLAAAGDLDHVHPDLVACWGMDTLAAVGVLGEPTVAELTDVVLEPAAVDDELLPDLGTWVEDVACELPGPASAPVVRGIRELDVVADDAWVALLQAVAADPALRAALVEPVPVTIVAFGGDASSAGGGRFVEPHPAWWVRTHGRLDGRPPGEWALAGSELAGLWPAWEPPAGLAADVLSAAGVRTTFAALLARRAGAEELLDRLADPRAEVTPALLAAAYRALAEHAAVGVLSAPPLRLRVSPDHVVPAGEVTVLDHPAHLQLSWPRPPIVVPLSLAADLAELLDVDTTSDRAGGPVPPVPPGSRREVPAAARALLPGAPATWQEHDDLVVDGESVGWWERDGEVHASTLDGLAWGLAWVAGRWDARWAVAAVLGDPDRLPEVLAESALDG